MPLHYQELLSGGSARISGEDKLEKALFDFCYCHWHGLSTSSRHSDHSVGQPAYTILLVDTAPKG